MDALRKVLKGIYPDTLQRIYEALDEGNFDKMIYFMPQYECYKNIMAITEMVDFMVDIGLKSTSSLRWYVGCYDKLTGHRYVFEQETHSFYEGDPNSSYIFEVAHDLYKNVIPSSVSNGEPYIYYNFYKTYIMS